MLYRIVKLLTALLGVLLLWYTITLVTSASYAPVDKMEAASSIADQARAIGELESSPIIQRAQSIWWKANSEYQRDTDLVATAIFYEAWGDCSTRHRELVGAVILNRLLCGLWGDTIYQVLTAPGQYAINFPYLEDKNKNRARENPEIWAECRKIAQRVLRGEVECPENVIFQSNFKQGTGVYEVHKTSYSTTYFCYGRIK